MSAVQKAVRLVAAMALKDVSDGYNLGQVCMSIALTYGYFNSILMDPLYVCALVPGEGIKALYYNCVNVTGACSSHKP